MVAFASTITTIPALPQVDRDISTGRLRSDLAEVTNALATDNIQNLTEIEVRVVVLCYLYIIFFKKRKIYFISPYQLYVL